MTVIFNKRFGRYRLVKKLASGGMAEVYLALKHGPDRFDKLVALKCMHEHLGHEPEAVEMFYREARLGALFQHPNLVHVLDADSIQSRHTMAMAFVPGVTVEDLQKPGDGDATPIAVELALHIAAEVALGLHHAHEVRDLDDSVLDVVHRDISPENILVGFDGETKLCDFGVAVAARHKDKSGGLAGKTAYMSPEQCRGQNVDRRSDVFALGIVLYEMLTGERLFRRDNPIQSIRAITEDEIPLPSTRRTELSTSIDEVVMHALARRPSDRYPSAHALHQALLSTMVAKEVVVGRRALAEVVSSRFSDERDELRAVIHKVLSAPEPSESTIDLTSMSGPSNDTTLQFDDADGLQELASPVRQPRGASAPIAIDPLAEHAHVAVANQLKRTTRLSVALALVAIAAVGVAAYLATQPLTEQTESVVQEVVVGTVNLSSTPIGAEITVDGEVRGEVTPASLPLPIGSAVIGLRRDGYVAEERRITVLAGEPIAIDVRLAVDETSPRAPIGRVRLTYEPVDATLHLDGEVLGSRSPVLVEALPLNTEHRLRLERAGYETLYLPVSLDSAEVLDMQVEMGEALDLGTFRFRGVPDGANLSINGESVAEAPLDDIELPANVTYTLELTRSGYSRWRRAVLLRPGAEQDVPVDMERRGARPAGSRDRGSIEAPSRAAPAPSEPRTEPDSPTPVEEEPAEEYEML
ncbi:MAG: serine/threonine protein kinase [Bradymonadia bacterium]